MDWLRKIINSAPPAEEGWNRHIAVVFHKGRLVSIGSNKNKSHPIAYKFRPREGAIYLHAEVDALIKASRLVDTSQCHLYVFRLNKKGLLMNSRPCIGCCKAIEDYKVEKAFYSTGQEERFAELH